MSDDTPIKIVFSPNAFDGFDGTQEELDELVEEIKRMVADGSLFENSYPVEAEDLSPEMLEKFEEAIKAFEGEDQKKRLN